MIAPMKKVHLVLLEREKAAGLKSLRRLGVVHLEPVSGRGPAHEDAARRLAEVERALAIVSSIKGEESAPASSGADAAREILRVQNELRAVEEELASLRKEHDRIRDWGDFEPSAVREIAEQIHLGLVECPATRVSSLPEDVRYIRLASPKGKARLAILRVPGMAELPSDFVELQLPARSLGGIREALRAAGERDISSRAALVALASSRGALQAEREMLAQDLTFETVRSGIESEGPVAYLSGYIPASELPRLQAEAKSSSWALVAGDPGPDASPPTKVENSAAVRIIAPVFQFLGTVPGYREYDISAWFLIFFSLYFAMIFGDGGYGLIMLVGGLIGALKAKRAGRKLSDGLRLLLVLASTTVAWGLATATWFAIPADRLPDFVLRMAVPPIRNGNPDADTNIKIFCFIVGAVQLALAHLKNIRRDFPNLKFLAQLGSLAMVVGMFTLVLNLIVDPRRFPIPTWALACVGGGFLLVFVFANWEGKLIKAILEGFKGIIPTFLGTVSVFADIVSYIRLWAVGLAGLAISQTVNGMASGLFGEPAGRIVAFVVGAVMGVILLGVGHALNLVMSVLSVVVHGIRLNMLEFSGHLGMEWSGYRYDPFRETARVEPLDRKENT